ncbi:Alpha/Beta hydrolase protein [Dichotomocladium elegans]|nr:Alpha/Beta hydrolase protein [Dichotomocladium elegans]
MIVLTWGLLEAAFYIYCLYKKQQFQKYIRPANVPTAEERRSLFWNCYHIVCEDVEPWLTGWFYVIKSPTHEAPAFHEIYRENVATWLSWAFWVESLDVVRKNQAWAAELEWMLSTIEQRCSIKFSEGYNDEIRCIRPNLDPVQSLHRPLIMYVGSYLLTVLFNCVFFERFWKFERRGTDAPGVMFGHLLRPFYKPSPMGKSEHMFHHLVYWYRPPGGKHVTNTSQAAASSPTPIVFFHGIGGGDTFYGEFIYRLLKSSGHRPIFCIELPYASMRLVEHIPSPEETVAEVERMLDLHGYQEAIFVGHSLGTAAASWVSNLAPQRVGGMVLVDPICFMLNYHHVAYNMLCRVPKTVLEHLILYFVSRELYVNYYISRHFQWYRSILFVQDAPTPDSPAGAVSAEEHLEQHSENTLKKPLQNATVYLSEHDPLVDSYAIDKYLTFSGVPVRMMEKAGHAEFLIRGPWKKEILSQIEKAARIVD